MEYSTQHISEIRKIKEYEDNSIDKISNTQHIVSQKFRKWKKMIDNSLNKIWNSENTASQLLTKWKMVTIVWIKYGIMKILRSSKNNKDKGNNPNYSLYGIRKTLKYLSK